MISCIAIDDEPLALKQIVSYVSKTPYLNLIEQFDNAISALEFLQSHKVDLMFVDINMPDLSGMDFVKSIENPPGIIFTTAYSEFAIESYKVNALDYLLKPISYADFLRAANKALKTLENRVGKSTVPLKEDYLFVKSEYKVLKIKFSEITFIESMRDYVRINQTNDKAIMTLSTLKKIEHSLVGENFMRVHRSYIVNLNHIVGMERNLLLFKGNKTVPVSEQYQASVREFIDKNYLD